ncbi:30S ribosomal protein S2 [Patescibacteria group bacterium]|nr:30S ribosomal protein S2 [Patescibacteria group bacterium]
MKEITLEELLEAGCHFGHQIIRSNPKARDFVFEARDGIQIIDLGKTKEGLDEAAAYIKDLSAKGGTVLVVGTKRQAQSTIKEEVARANEAIKEDAQTVFYITNRWVGGILTNISEISKNIKKLKDITKMLLDPEEKSKYTKKELGLFDKEKQRLLSLYEGIMEMQKPPSALFIVDSKFEDLAVKEAMRMRTPTVGMVDTNADPALIDWPIPANDDAVGSIKLIVSHIMDAWIEGKKKAGDVKQKADKESKKTEEKTELKEKEVKPAVKKEKATSKKTVKAKTEKTAKKK